MVSFDAAEEEVHFIDALIDVPMAAVPRFIVRFFFDGVEPAFGAIIHGALINAGKECFDGLVFERTGVRQDHVKILFFYLLFNVTFDFVRGLFICPPAVATRQTVPPFHSIVR